jgi:hypothetical protein
MIETKGNRDPSVNKTKHGGDSPLIFEKKKEEREKRAFKRSFAMTSCPCPREWS